MIVLAVIARVTMTASANATLGSIRARTASNPVCSGTWLHSRRALEASDIGLHHREEIPL